MAIEAQSLDHTYEMMSSKLAGITPDLEMRYKAELVWEINCLKRERNAVILGHNYMEPALFHTVADICGDSLQLSREAATTDAEVIVFCGVRFMAETAKILSPEKKVLLPADVAGCSLAASISAADVIDLRERYPGIPVVSYVNTYADVKAVSDACCTSGNAVKVVESFDSDSIIFLPDEFLAANVARDCEKKIIFPSRDPERSLKSEVNFERTMIGWPGRCEVHEKFTVEDIENARKQSPGVLVLAHPECPPEVTAAADFSGSTKAMIDYVAGSDAESFLLLTECAMGDNIVAAYPDKELLRMCSVRCPHMNEITLESTLKALREDHVEIDVPEPARTEAKRALDYMIKIN